MPRTAGIEMLVNTDTASKERLIYLGIPTFGMVSIEFMAHLMQLQSPLNRNVAHGYAKGYEVGQARNFLVNQALSLVNDHGHTVSHVFFIDDDVLVPHDALSRLLAHKRPIISGLYYAKTAAPQPLVLMAPAAGVADLPASGVVDCYGHGMGCTLIEIGVFRAMLEQGVVEFEELPNKQVLPQFFKTTKDERRTDEASSTAVSTYQTEDLYFLERAAKLGYTPAVDVDLFCWHFDAKSGRRYPLVAPGGAQ